MNTNELSTPFLPTGIQIPIEEDRLRTYLVDTISDISYTMNNKTIGTFAVTEQYNGELWNYGTTTEQVQKTRNGFQILLYFPSLTNGASQPNPIPNIDANTIMTMCYGTATLPFTTPGSAVYFSFLGNGDSRIQLSVTDQTVTITTDGTLDAYQGYVILQYIKAGN